MEKITFEEFDQWQESQSGVVNEEGFFDDGEFFEEEGVQFHKGDLRVANLEVAPCVVVDGNLIIDGEINSPFDQGLLVVTGDLRCQHFSFRFQTVVAGNLYADTIRVDSGCDYALTIGGDIHANSVIEAGHCITVKGHIYSPIIETSHYLSVNGIKMPSTPSASD